MRRGLYRSSVRVFQWFGCLLIVSMATIGCTSAEPTAAPPTLATLAPLDESATSPTTTAVSDFVFDSEPAPAESYEGLIVLADRLGMTVVDPTGDRVASLADQSVVRQPTWSRNGDRIVATLVDPGTGATTVGAVDADTWTLRSAPAFRPYFFYSWDPQGERIAALGPGRAGGTSVDFIDSGGQPTADSTIAGGSMFVAWEPDGSTVLLHANERMLHVVDFTDVESSIDLGSPGVRFQAPSWIPGSREYLIAEGDGDEVQLVRLGVAGGSRRELGPLDGSAAMSVHPDGAIAAVSHGTVNRPNPGVPDTVFAAFQPARRTTEIVDLETGERTKILDELGLWLEWAPDGERLLIAVEREGRLSWLVWDGETTTELARLLPTLAFLQQYLPFAEQYTESPRLWSPDGRAFVITAIVEGNDRAIVVDAETGRTAPLGSASVAFWSPAG